MNKITVVSPFDMQLRKKFFRFYYTHRSFTLYVIMVLFVVLLFMAINSTVNATDTTKMSSIIMAWIMVGVIGILFPLFLVGRTNSTLNQQRKLIGKENEYLEFSHDKILRSIRGQGKEVYAWSVFQRAYELPDAIFLFGESDAGLIVKKADITPTDVDGSAALALRKMIEAHIARDKKGRARYKITYKEKA